MLSRPCRQWHVKTSPWTRKGIDFSGTFVFEWDKNYHFQLFEGPGEVKRLQWQHAQLVQRALAVLACALVADTLMQCWRSARIPLGTRPPNETIQVFM